MDNLEDFVNKNRGEFDAQSPRPELWDRIKESKEEHKDVVQLTPKKAPYQVWQSMKIAASIAILFLAAFGGYKLLEDNPAYTVVRTTGQEELTSEMAELDSYYENQIRGQYIKVESLVASDEILEEIRNELEILDAEKAKLIEDYDRNANTQEIVEALMNTYKMKLDVLENILSLLNETENENNAAL